MALEDRLQPSVDAALDALKARVDQDVRALLQQLMAMAQQERDDSLAAARQQAIERHSDAAALTRLLDSISVLDRATRLSEVLDALALAAARETSRAAVFVIRQERLIGWKVAGFGPHDAEPKALDLGVSDGGVVGEAVRTGRSARTGAGDTAPRGPGFAGLPADSLGLAAPIIVGGRVVAVVYADGGVDSGDREHAPASSWPEVIEILARHGSRCLDALTAQKAVYSAAPRFWVQAAGRTTPTAESVPTAISDPRSAAADSDAPPGITT